MASIVGRPSGASAPGHARTSLEWARTLATIWTPGQTHPTLCGAEQLLATELVFEGHMKWAEGDAMTAVERESERRLERDDIRETRKSVAIAGRSGTRRPTSCDTILTRRPGCVIPHRLLPRSSKSHVSWRCCVLGCVASDCLYLPVY